MDAFSNKMNRINAESASRKTIILTWFSEIAAISKIVYKEQ